MAEAVNRATGRKAPARGDVTALQMQALEEERDAKAAEELREKKRVKEVEDLAKKHKVIDYSGADTPLPEHEEDEDNDDPYREIIARFDVEDMAYGREIIKDPVLNDDGEQIAPAELGGIRFLNFKEGRRYRVPRELAEHMDERGLVWH